MRRRADPKWRYLADKFVDAYCAPPNIDSWRDEPHVEVEITFRRCRVCGCTDDDCRGCVAKTGAPCHWIEYDLCSACAARPGSPQAEKAAQGVTDRSRA
jgi:hypothetical protein